MTALLVLPMSLALVAIAPGLGWGPHVLIALLLFVMLGTGQLVCRKLGCRNDPFLSLVAGFVLVSHALVAADLIVPGAHWAVAAAFAIPAIAGFYGAAPGKLRAALGIAVCTAVFTFAWNIDVASRLAAFYSTGRLEFWLDILVHAGNLAEFATPDAIGRGMVLMADTPRPLYHYATYMPSALLTTVFGTSPLDVAVLAWIPLGVLVMACGVASLGLTLGGLTLGGPSLAVLALAALAFLPAPERLTLDNGFLGFAWLLETAPGTPYSLGVGCAALTALIRWQRGQRTGTLVLAFFLTAGCFLVRANTFILLAPTVALGAIVCWQRPTPRLRRLLLGLGLFGLVAFLIALSWSLLRADARQFLFGYVEFVLRSNGPSRFDSLYPILLQHVGRIGAGALGVGLTLIGTLGPWLPVFAILGVLAWRRNEPSPADAMPVLLLVVASLAIVLAPNARNGDISEFRHRGGPLLVAVLCVWSLRFAAVFAAPLLRRISLQGRRGAVAGAAALSMVVLASSIGSAKRPRMAWGGRFYDSYMAPELQLLAPLLSQGVEQRRRFAVANQPPEARNIDDAARLVALSGVPAYISCPAFMVSTGGQIGIEAQRRMAVLTRLAEASSLLELRATMRAEDITHYIVTTVHDAAFDPERRSAIGRAGAFAIYSAVPSG